MMTVDNHRMVKYGILHPAWGDFLRFSTSSPFFQPSPLYSPFLHVFSFPSHSKPKSLRGTRYQVTYRVPGEATPRTETFKSEDEALIRDAQIRLAKPRRFDKSILSDPPWNCKEEV